MIVGQLLQRGQTVFGKDIPVVAFNGKLFFVDNGIRTALFKSLGCKGVAVERFAFQRKENRTLGQSRLSVVTCGCSVKILYNSDMSMCDSFIGCKSTSKNRTMTILRPNNNLFCTYFLTFVTLLIQKKLLMKQKIYCYKC